jgi:hypothetical protein
MQRLTACVAKNKSSVREVMKIKEKIRAGFYVAQQTAKFLR